MSHICSSPEIQLYWGKSVFPRPLQPGGSDRGAPPLSPYLEGCALFMVSFCKHLLLSLPEEGRPLSSSGCRKTSGGKVGAHP